jgi:cellulose synthase/poly-beta-1,6-N-acetylglucosamine synthase-like glycosyltransferase
MAGLFAFVGINFVFWVLVGLVRFVSERAFTTLGITRAASNLKAFTEEHFHFLQSGFGMTGALLGGIGAFLGFVAFFTATGILDGAASLPTQASVYSSLEAWIFFALIAGYIASRIEVERPLKSALFGGISYFLFRVATIIAYSGIPYLNLGIALAALGFLLALALFFGFLGGIAGGHFNREDRRREARLKSAIVERIRPEEVAAIVPAHNEEKKIAKTIASLRQVLAAENIYIGSDASTDKTVEIARSLGAVVADIRPNRGKAGVLAYLIEENKLCDRYKAVMIVDADSEVAPNYLEKALPLFDDPDVVALAVHTMSKWQKKPTEIAGLILSYRVRLYRVLQATIRYGQTWKYTNVTPIAPGFAALYRASALRQITVNPPGLVIEDFNMTFEVYHKKLGTIAYSPEVHGISSGDPLTLKDYYKQVKRWNLGLWQTIRRHGFWPSLFSLSLFSFLVEMLFTSIFIVALPFLIAAMLFLPDNAIHTPVALGLSYFELTLYGVVIFLVLDYLMTVFVAIYEKKPILLLDGFAFIILRYIDAWTFIITLPLAFTARSDGKWVSPKR